MTSPAAPAAASGWLPSWWKTRKFWRLLPGLPALVAVALFGSATVFVLTREPSALEQPMASQADKAFAAGNFETARLGYAALLRLGLNPGKYALQLAQTLMNMGRPQQAASLLATLAAGDGAGKVPTHLALARALLTQGSTSADIVRAAQAHLLRVARAEPQNAEMLHLLGFSYLHLQRPAEAKAQLEKVAPTRGDSAALMAVACRALGETNQARRWADEAANLLQPKLLQENVDEMMTRLSLAEVYSLLGRYEQACAVLEEGVQRLRLARFRTGVAQACVLWYDATPATDAERRLAILQRGLNAVPFHEPLLRQLAFLSFGTNNVSVLARAKVEGLLNQRGPAALVLHAQFCELAYAGGHLASAVHHSQQTYEIAPDMPLVANNYAALLAKGDQPDFAKALSVIDPVVRGDPDEPIYRDTRGSILLGLGRYQEAIKDYEAALPKLNARSGAHAALAVAYAKIGLKELAVEHEKRAAEEKKKEQASPPQRQLPANPAKEPRTP